MDATDLARSLLDEVPAHASFGIEVVRAVDGCAEVALLTLPAMTNVIGSLHSSGLIALADAAGLAAIIAASQDEEQYRGVLPLGASAALDFRSPARGRLVARCELGSQGAAAVRQLLIGATERVRISTTADIRDEAGVLTCRGTFSWSIRRLAAADA